MIANRFNPLIVCGLLMLALGAVTVQSAVLGIDFGSEIIKMAIVKPGTPFHIITDEHSKRKIPALIAFDDERYFGTAASNLLVRKPKHTYANLRWLLGKNASSPQVQRFSDDFYPFTFKPIPERGTVAIEHSDELEFSTELLVSMMLQYLRRLAEAESKAVVKDAVITVPSFWTHKERQALLDAASLAGMNVLSLINQNTAAAVQYGIDFNFKEDTSSPIIFYNMGSSGTEATLAVYSAYNKKQGKQNKTIGQFEVKGVAYDEFLGGQSFDQRIMQQMITELNKKVKKSGEDVDVRTVPRSIAKLRQSARRVKEVLSANTETGATIESAYADVDLKWPVTRDAFYGWCEDLFERVPKPIEQLLQATGYKLSDVSAVVLLGGSTRIPKVEQVLKQYLKDNGFPSEISKNIDADESMAMGAAFFAANLSTQFRVRQFGASDVHAYPIGVRFSDLPGATPSVETESAPASADESVGDSGSAEDDKAGSSDSEAEKKTAGFSKRASLFKRFNSLNKRKTVVFTHSTDFQCNMNYDSADILPLGVTPGITSYNVTGLSALPDHPKYGKLLATQKPKVQLSFTLTTDGTVELSKAEALLEETVTEKVKKPKKKADKAADTKAPAEPKEAAADDVEKSKPAEGDASESAAPADANAEAKTDGESAPETKAEPKEPAADAPATPAEDEFETKQVKKTHTIPLLILGEGIDVKPIGTADRTAAAAILAKLNAADQHRKDIAAAKNELEAFIYNMRPKFENDNVVKVTTKEQRDEVFAKLDAAQEWLYEQADDEVDKFKTKLKEVRKLTDPVFFRVEEAEQRAPAVNATMSMLNYTRVVLEKLEKERTWVKEESRKELADSLKELEEWVEKKLSEQGKKAAHETPAFTADQLLKKLKPVTTLAADLLKIPKPKPKPAPKPKNNSTANANATAADANSTSSTVDAEATGQSEVEAESESAASENKAESEAETEAKPESEAAKDKKEDKKEKKEKAKKEEPKKEDKKKKGKKDEL